MRKLRQQRKSILSDIPFESCALSISEQLTDTIQINHDHAVNMSMKLIICLSESSY